MGYTTDFEGTFILNRPLTLSQMRYLKQFNQTRRMKRDEAATEKRPDPVRKAVKLPVGIDGEYFVGADGMFGQEDHDAVGLIEYNDPPQTQPGLWCQWTPTEDGKGIKWDGGEKFYYYVEWLQYIIDNFLKRWKRVLNGRVTWRGESHGDTGTIVVKDNVIQTLKGRTGKVTAIEEGDDPDEARVEAEYAELASAQPPAIVVRTEKSKSNPKSKPHEVRISRTDGKMYCTCKGWQNMKDCRHLKATTKEHILDALEQAGAEGGIGI